MTNGEKLVRLQEARLQDAFMEGWRILQMKEDDDCNNGENDE